MATQDVAPGKCSGMAHMFRSEKNRQTGMTLIEVLVATLILSGGLLGGAVAQLNALKHTDSAMMSTQANFIAYDMLDRIRANAGADYSFSGADLQQGVAGPGSVLGQDLNDFKRNIRQFGGASAKGAIALSGQQVTITLEWDDSRASNSPGSLRTFTLTSQVAADAIERAS